MRTKEIVAKCDQLTDEPSCVAELNMILGEGPVWVASRNAFFFTDIKGIRIYELSMEDKTVYSWKPPEVVAFLLPANDDTLVLGHPHSLGQFSLKTHKFSTLKTVDSEPKNNRLNDGCICPDGHIWFGTMDDNKDDSTGAIYSVSAETVEISRKDHQYTISNGPAVSPDGKTVYICDSPHQIIYAYDCINGGLCNCRAFVRLSDGYPDGIVTDSEGNLWSAVWNGWRVDCYSPKGEKLFTKKFPVANVTKIAFGGDDMRDVLVTTASKGLTAEAKEAQPLAGSIFMFRSDVPGNPQALFKIK